METYDRHDGEVELEMLVYVGKKTKSKEFEVMLSRERRRLSKTLSV